MDKKASYFRSSFQLAVAHRSTPWHAVSIVTGRWCCEAARQLLGSRYLSKQAPRLPLEECSSAEHCSCLYKHHGDRRGVPRRKDEAMGMRRPAHLDNDRRVSRGRREDD
jgi:hypothetical protein